MSNEHDRILSIALDSAIDHAAQLPTLPLATPSAWARKLLGNDATVRLVRSMDTNRAEFQEFGGARVNDDIEL